MKNKYVCSKCYGYIHFKDNYIVVTEGSSLLHGADGKLEFICKCGQFIFIDWVAK